MARSKKDARNVHMKIDSEVWELLAAYARKLDRNWTEALETLIKQALGRTKKKAA